MPYLRLLRQDRRQISALPNSFGLGDVRAGLLQIINKARDQIVAERHVLLLPPAELNRQLHAVAIFNKFVRALLSHIVIALSNFIGHFYFFYFICFGLLRLLLLFFCLSGSGAC